MLLSAATAGLPAAALSAMNAVLGLPILIWLILLLIVLYLIFCNDNNGRGGLFGGLF